MKSSVLAALMSLMVLSFGLNAFSAVSSKAVNARLKQLVPANQPNGFMAMGTSGGGKDCEVSLGADAKGNYGIMISVRTMFAMAHFVFDVGRNITLTGASDNGSKIVLKGTSQLTNLQTALVLELVQDKNGRSIKSAEIIDEVEGFFGKKNDSVRCSI